MQFVQHASPRLLQHVLEILEGAAQTPDGHGRAEAVLADGDLLVDERVREVVRPARERADEDDEALCRRELGQIRRQLARGRVEREGCAMSGPTGRENALILRALAGRWSVIGFCTVSLVASSDDAP